MKNLGDELAAAGRPVSDPEMVDYVLAGLDRDYDPVVAAIGAIKNSISVDDLFAQISAFDQRMEMLGDGPAGFRSSANAAVRGRGGGSRGRGSSRNKGDLEDTVVAETVVAATAALVHPAVVVAAVHLGPDQRCLAAKFAVSQGTPRRIAGTVMMKMTRTPKMKKKWLPRPMDPTASTQIGTLIAEPPTTSPMSLRR